MILGHMDDGTTLILFAAVAAMAGIFLLVGVAIWGTDRPRSYRWLERHPFECESCGRRLSDRQAVTVTEEFPEEYGGTSITATFCKDDAP